jgi:NAD(P)-dependent dehydrogenase (short-subunit alcohol dehydrogenase family)
MEEKNVLIIGGSSGVGLEIVKTLTGQTNLVYGGIAGL